MSPAALFSGEESEERKSFVVSSQDYDIPHRQKSEIMNVERSYQPHNYSQAIIN
jgi:hypothetical protein